MDNVFYVSYAGGEGTVIFRDLPTFLGMLNAYAVSIDKHGEVEVLIVDEEDDTCLIWQNVTDLCLHKAEPKRTKN